MENSGTNKFEITDGMLERLKKNPYNYASNIPIDRLSNILISLSNYYYNTGETQIDDNIYDIIEDVLKERDTTGKYMKIIKESTKIKNDSKLPFPMPSLEKIKHNTDTLSKWLLKYEGPYVISDKLDGMSGMLHIANGIKKLYKKTTPEYGTNISSLMRYMNMPKISEKNISIRGELIISKNNFEKIKKDYKNSRNAVSGIINAATHDINKKGIKNKLKLIDFVSYSIIFPEMNQKKQMRYLDKMNYNVVNYEIHYNLADGKLNNYLINRRKIGEYLIDGIVVIDSSNTYKTTNKNPKHGFAFKTVLSDQCAETTVVDVEWNITKDGYIVPKILIEPLEIGGVTIVKATGHNAKYIHDNKIGPGTVVEIVRSGDVIPYINKIIKNTTAKMPSIAYKWNKSKVNIIVEDIHKDSNNIVVIKKISNFFSKLEIKNIREGVITKMVNSGFNSLFSIMKAILNDDPKLLEIDGIGKKTVLKIKNNIILGIKDTTLERLMAASGIFGRLFGVRRIKMIIDEYPNVLKDEITLDDILGIYGFDKITANIFIDQLETFKIFFKNLNEIIDISHLLVSNKSDESDKSDKSENSQDTEDTKKIFENKIIVFTGFRDKELQKFVENNGGKMGTSVSSKTNLIVYSNKNESYKTNAKFVKATNLGIETITRNDFMAKFM